MSRKPDGLYPDFNSYIFDTVRETQFLQWTNIGEEPSHSTVVISGPGVSITREVYGSNELDISDIIDRFSVGSTYSWNVANRYLNSGSVHSKTANFKFGRISLSGQSSFGNLPKYIDIVERNSYMKEFRERAIDLTLFFEMSSELKERAKSLFNGDVVPSYDDFKTLDDIFMIASKGSYGKGVLSAKTYISDSLGVSDIKRIRELFMMIESMSLSETPSVDISFGSTTNNEIGTLVAKQDGINDNSIELVSTISYGSSESPSLILNYLPTSDAGRYTKVELGIGTGVESYSLALYYPNTLNNGHREVMSLNPSSSMMGGGSSLRVTIGATSYNVFDSASAVYRNEKFGYGPGSKPMGLEKIEIQFTRRKPTESKVYTGIWTFLDYIRGLTMTHMLYNSEGHFAYRARYIDKNGYVGRWVESNFITHELPKPILLKPDAPRLSYTSTASSATVTWPAAARADGYEWKLWSSDNNIVRTTSRSFTRGSLASQREYDFYVRAYNKAGVSAWTYIKAKTKGLLTTSWTATYGNSWRDKHLGKYTGRSSWRVRGENGYGEVLQGEWVELAGSPNRVPGYPVGHAWGKNMGVWLFNSADMRAKLAGKTIRKVEIYVTRGEVHGYYHAQELGIYQHRMTSAPSQFSPAPHFFGRVYSKTAVKISSSAWIELPVSVGENLKTGHANGIGLYAGSGQRLPYMRFNKNATIRITYE